MPVRGRLKEEPYTHAANLAATAAHECRDALFPHLFVPRSQAVKMRRGYTHFVNKKTTWNTQAASASRIRSAGILPILVVRYERLLRQLNCVSGLLYRDSMQQPEDIDEDKGYHLRDEKIPEWVHG